MTAPLPAADQPERTPSTAPHRPGESGAGRLPRAPAFLAGCRRLDGFVPLFRDEATGRLHLLVRRVGMELLYVNRLSHAVGDYRLERGGLSRPQVVRFDREGTKLFLTAVNYAWRSSSPEAPQRLAVRQAFPESILWSFEIIGETEEGLLVDGTEFCLRDPRDLAGLLSDVGEG